MSPTSSPDQLQALLHRVTRMIKRDDWVPKNYTQLLRDCQELGIQGGPSMSFAIARVLEEVRPEHFSAPTQVSYNEPYGADLYRFNWFSTSLNQPIHFKFCFADDGTLWLYSFHRQRDDNAVR